MDKWRISVLIILSIFWLSIANIEDSKAPSSTDVYTIQNIPLDTQLQQHEVLYLNSKIANKQTVIRHSVVTYFVADNLKSLFELLCVLCFYLSLSITNPAMRLLHRIRSPSTHSLWIVKQALIMPVF